VVKDHWLGREKAPVQIFSLPTCRSGGKTDAGAMGRFVADLGPIDWSTVFVGSPEKAGGSTCLRFHERPGQPATCRVVASLPRGSAAIHGHAGRSCRSPLRP
jgi:hypothetical protein